MFACDYVCMCMRSCACLCMYGVCKLTHEQRSSRLQSETMRTRALVLLLLACFGAECYGQAWDLLAATANLDRKKALVSALPPVHTCACYYPWAVSVPVIGASRRISLASTPCACETPLRTHMPALTRRPLKQLTDIIVQIEKNYKEFSNVTKAKRDSWFTSSNDFDEGRGSFSFQAS